jgi:hypothetical protein
VVWDRDEDCVDALVVEQFLVAARGIDGLADNFAGQRMRSLGGECTWAA